MPSKKLNLLAAAGNAGDSLYVEDVFSTYLYTGSSSNQTITNGIDLDGEGGLVWIKNRTNTTGHFLSDTNRGVVGYLRTESNGASVGASNVLTSYNSNGFGISTNSGVNASPQNYCSWTFRKAPGFFDIVTYTGDAVVGREIAHNLETTPSMIIVKSTGAQGNWYVWHKEANSGDGYLLLNTTAAINTGGKYVWGNNVNYIAPTDTEFTVAGGTAVNGSGTEYVAYIFGDDASFGADGDESIIKCGSYTTDGSGKATVNLGFEPQWILSKRTNAAGAWYIRDVMRGMPVDGDNALLSPNTSGAEAASSFALRPSATGFTAFNDAASQTNIYIAIRRPMKVPEAGTEVYNNLANRIGTSAAATISGVGFAVDLMIPFAENTGSSKPFVDRLRGATRYLLPPYGNAEQTTTDAVTSFASNDGVLVGADASLQVINNYYNSSRRYAASFFKRASGFMDVVCWKGDGTSNGSHKPAHGLTVVPQFIISKVRDAADNWACLQSEAVGGAVYIMLNNTTGGNAGNLKYYYGDGTNYVPPTSSVFTVTTGGSLNVSGKAYVSYLFATLAGVSKVGSYTGTGADLNVDCGFTAGARFILIKRTDSAGDFYMWDSARGINAGNSPYLIMNTTGASVTTTDYIDPLNAGFTVTSTAPAAINASGGSYIFLAIA